ncbi:hypothetical protein CU048_01285 [Beijerinckiaceae bacterium]|nr:hypothetical protein CU048_01285 [Beijerinckiaceae bacterium]
MKTSKIYLFAIPMAIAGSIALSGCGRSTANPTVISYKQIGICKTYDTPTGPQTTKGNEGFAIFKIETIDNTKYNNIFNLDPSRLYVNQSNPEQMAKGVYSWNRRFVNPDPRFAQNLGFSPIVRATVPAGEKIDPKTFIVIPLGIDNPSQGPDENKYNFTLAYDTGTDDRGNIQSVSEGLLFVKGNAPDTKWTVVENCKELPLK